MIFEIKLTFHVLMHKIRVVLIFQLYTCPVGVEVGREGELLFRIRILKNCEYRFKVFRQYNDEFCIRDR